LRITSGHSFDHLVGAGGQFGADNFDFASYDIELKEQKLSGSKRRAFLKDCMRK
jgi:hypothetical protein